MYPFAVVGVVLSDLEQQDDCVVVSGTGAGMGVDIAPDPEQQDPPVMGGVGFGAETEQQDPEEVAGGGGAEAAGTSRSMGSVVT